MKRIFTEELSEKNLDDNASVADASSKDVGKRKGTSKSKKAAKGKGKKQEVEETPEQQAYRILAEIAEQRRKQAEENLYPDPDEKIFFSKPKKQLNMVGSCRDVMPNNIKKLGFNDYIFQQPVNPIDTQELKQE